MINDILAIDFQNDFAHKQGNLFVPGADQDVIRAATMIDRLSNKITNIRATLDSHNYVDIAHSVCWVDKDGKNPNVFTIITHKDVVDKVWRITIPGMENWAEYYTLKLEEGGKYPLCIWPQHCVINHTEKRPVLSVSGHTVYNEIAGLEHNANLEYDFCGHALCEPISNSFSKWCKENIKTIHYLIKGTNPLTESYSIQAEVPRENDDSYIMNNSIAKLCTKANNIIVLGEALSHCVASVLEGLFSVISEDQIKKFILVTDCCSNVPGFEKNGVNFVNKYVAKGMRTAKSTEIEL